MNERMRYDYNALQKFCNENNLSTAKMKRNINKGIILPPKKNTKSMTLESKNCVGWEVKLIC